MELLIKELQSLVVKKQMTINSKDYEIDKLKAEITRLEELNKTKKK